MSYKLLFSLIFFGLSLQGFGLARTAKTVTHGVLVFSQHALKQSLLNDLCTGKIPKTVYGCPIQQVTTFERNTVLHALAAINPLANITAHAPRKFDPKLYKQTIKELLSEFDLSRTNRHGHTAIELARWKMNRIFIDTIREANA